MDLDVSGSSPPDTSTAVLQQLSSNSLPFSSHFYDPISPHYSPFYRQPSASLDLCGFPSDSGKGFLNNEIIDLRQSPASIATQKGFCTNPSCILPSPPLTGSDLKRTVPLPHVHPVSAPHHHIRVNSSISSFTMQREHSVYHTPPSPPLTIPITSQSLPDIGDSSFGFSQPSSLRASSILERQSTLDSPELLTPVSPAWHFASSSKSELGSILQDPLEFEPDPVGYIHDMHSPSLQPASLPPFEGFPGQEDSWEARRLPQPFSRWSPGGDVFDSDSELDEDLLRPPESPRPTSMFMDLSEDGLLSTPPLASSSRIGLDTDFYGQSDVEMDPLSTSIDSLRSGGFDEHSPPSPRSPLLRLRACLDSDESFSSMESTMPAEDDEFTASLSLPAMLPPPPVHSLRHNVLASPSRRSFASLPDPDIDVDDPYCPTPLAAFNSPSRRSFTTLPDLDSEDEFGIVPSYSGTQEQRRSQFDSPRQTLLSLPGVETDEDLLPSPEPSSTVEPEPILRSDSGLLLVHPADGSLPSREDEAEVLSTIPLALREDPEVLAIAALRGRLLASERHARSVESAFAARVAQTGKVLLACMYNCRLGVEDGEEVMGELRRELKEEKDRQGVAKRVRKKEKERGREVGALIRLKVAERAGGEGGRESGHAVGHGHGHGHKGKHRDCCGHGGIFTSVQQLVAKMVFKRRESYRPLTNRRANPFRRSASLLSQSITIVDLDDGFDG